MAEKKAINKTFMHLCISFVIMLAGSFLPAQHRDTHGDAGDLRIYRYDLWLVCQHYDVAKPFGYFDVGPDGVHGEFNSKFYSIYY